MRNITLSADDALIDAAREQAKADNSSINEQFRLWLQQYTRKQRMRRYEELMAELRGKVVVGHKLTRDEMNER